MQKYLGEAAHFVVINRELNEFVHAHPAAASAAANTRTASIQITQRLRKTPRPILSLSVAARVKFPKA